MRAERVRKTAGALALFALGMFAFGYALAPLYRVYCDLTGRGSNNALSAAAARSATRDEDRLVTVVFDTNTRDIPWSFKAERHKMRVRPGELNEAVFLVRNKSGRNITGRAIPSVSPVQAGIYFSKTECFCFLEQALAPGEDRAMRVRFLVDAGLPERFSSLTLSYTFFGVDSSDVAARAGPAVAAQPQA